MQLATSLSSRWFEGKEKANEDGVQPGSIQKPKALSTNSRKYKVNMLSKWENKAHKAPVPRQVWCLSFFWDFFMLFACLLSPPRDTLKQLPPTLSLRAWKLMGLGATPSACLVQEPWLLRSLLPSSWPGVLQMTLYYSPNATLSGYYKLYRTVTTPVCSTSTLRHPS